VLESFIASYDSLAVIHSHIISVRFLSIFRAMLYTDVNQGKRCDCKSLHWKFSDKATCDGRVRLIRPSSILYSLGPDCGHTPMHHVCVSINIA
jgi:hypothetical protein